MATRQTGSRSLSLSNGRFGNRLGLTAWVSNTISQVLPSGGALATTALPVLPEAPVRFSITIVAPRRCDRPACARRATASTEPPGGNGTTIRIGPEGQLCARAASGASAAASTTERLDNPDIELLPDRCACAGGRLPPQRDLHRSAGIPATATVGGREAVIILRSAVILQWPAAPLHGVMILGDGCEMKGERIIEIDFASDRMREAFEVRYEVFVDEQGVPRELEADEFDPLATHLIAIRDGQVVGTLRMLVHGDAAKVGRVAVRAAARRTGIGGRLMERAAALARERGFAEIVLHAQVAVAGFYRRLGYVEEGDLFDEAGIPHIGMRKKIR